MGGGESKPAPPPTVIEQEPPAGSGESSILYPDRPGKPRLDGVTRALANECAECDLRVSSGISSSSVRLSREFGEVSVRQCGRYAADLRKVRESKMSVQDFIGNLQAGRYLRNLNNGYCEQVELSGDEALKVTDKDKYDESKLRSVRIQKISSGGFSIDTKAKLTPSIPFEMTFNGQKIPIKSMTVYHPCPLRLEGTQADAVLSLNDPGIEDGSSYVILVPLVSRNSADPSIEFFDKILPQIASLRSPDPTGQYPVRNIPTGDDWALTKVFSATVPPDGGGLQVTNGYYEWKGMPTLEQKREDGAGVINYKWVESGKPSPRYIMLDQPVAISSTSLSAITQSLPMTPVNDAVHAILYDTNPLQRGIVHKQGPSTCSTVREGFTEGMVDKCNPWSVWANQPITPVYGLTEYINIMFGLLGTLLGVYLALIAVQQRLPEEFGNLAHTIGGLFGTFLSNFTRQKQQDTTATINITSK